MKLVYCACLNGLEKFASTAIPTPLISGLSHGRQAFYTHQHSLATGTCF